MAGYNEELNKTMKESNESNSNTDNSFDINSIIDFTIENYKQILLLLLAFVIIYVVDYITYYNGLFFSMPSVIPGVSQSQPQTKSNTFKKKSGKNLEKIKNKK